MSVRWIVEPLDVIEYVGPRQIFRFTDSFLDALFL
jgi:hypothetical protein